MTLRSSLGGIALLIAASTSARAGQPIEITEFAPFVDGAKITVRLAATSTDPAVPVPSICLRAIRRPEGLLPACLHADDAQNVYLDF